MEALFLKILNMSVTASWLAVAVAVLRLVFRKAPKALRVLLWALVGLRLILPISFESKLSLIPTREPITPETIYVGSSEQLTNPAQDSIAPLPQQNSETDPSQQSDSVDGTNLVKIASILWISGALGMLIYAAISYLMLARKTSARIPMGNRIYLCDNVNTPFILGIFCPKIILPSRIEDRFVHHVIAHETAHLKRKDHWWKPLGYTILCLHWFNPFVWGAYVLLCRDIELACDEKAIRKMPMKERADYTETLLSCSISRNAIAACPLAFGEIAVKDRIKAVLNYKKPTFWVIILTCATSVAVAAGLLTDPVGTGLKDIENCSGIWKNVSEISLVTQHTGYTATEDGGNEILAALKDVEIESTPLDQSRDELRDRQNAVVLRYESRETKICFNCDCSKVWIYDGVKPTFTYRVLNPEEIQKIFPREYQSGGTVSFQEFTLPEAVHMEIRSKSRSQTDVPESLLLLEAQLEHPQYRNSVAYQPLKISQNHPSVFHVLIKQKTTFQLYDSDFEIPFTKHSLAGEGDAVRPAVATICILTKDGAFLGYYPGEFWTPKGNESGWAKELDEKFPGLGFGDAWEQSRDIYFPGYTEYDGHRESSGIYDKTLITDYAALSEDLFLRVAADLEEHKTSECIGTEVLSCYGILKAERRGSEISVFCIEKCYGYAPSEENGKDYILTDEYAGPIVLTYNEETEEPVFWRPFRNNEEEYGYYLNLYHPDYPWKDLWNSDERLNTVFSLEENAKDYLINAHS